MAIEQKTLRNKSYNYNQRLDEAKYTSLGRAKRSAFLCHSHSHRDEALVKGLIVVFREAGVDLYVDWLDQSMPETPNKQTALNIQKRIRHADLFIFLATENSKKSRWCPWEIGFADGVEKNVYIVPTSDGYHTYGNEYLELYAKIDAGTFRVSGNPGFFVTQPGADSGYGISNETLK